MKFLTKDAKIEKLKRKEAREKGYYNTKPVYVYLLSEDWLEQGERPYFLSKKLSWTSKLENAKQTRGFWEDFWFGFEMSFMRLEHLVDQVNIAPYLEELKRRWVDGE